MNSVNQACANVEEFAKRLKEGKACPTGNTNCTQSSCIRWKEEIDILLEEFKGSDKKAIVHVNGEKQEWEDIGSDKKDEVEA